MDNLREMHLHSKEMYCLETESSKKTENMNQTSINNKTESAIQKKQNLPTKVSDPAWLHR